MDPIVSHLLENRRLNVPEEDRRPLEEHWNKVRLLRDHVDESLLADHEIAVTFKAVGEPDGS